MQNARDRVRQIRLRVEAGDIKPIVRINNEQLIASREAKVIEANRKLQQASIKLSLFLRDNVGDPVLAEASQLPPEFPEPARPDNGGIDDQVARAVAASPAVSELDLLRQQLEVDRRNAENMLLPKLDARLLASKDIGVPASSDRNKTPFELEAGLFGEVPLQRRQARGKIHATNGKLAQIDVNKTEAASIVPLSSSFFIVI